MKHHTKDKGDEGVGRVIADLFSKGLNVCLPISEHLPFDIIGVRSNGDLLRISVKYRAAKNNTITVHFRSSYSTSKKLVCKPIDKKAIDKVAIYCPDTNTVYYINPSEHGSRITLRLKPAVNNQTKGTKTADDYLSL